MGSILNVMDKNSILCNEHKNCQHSPFFPSHPRKPGDWVSQWTPGGTAPSQYRQVVYTLSNWSLNVSSQILKKIWGLRCSSMVEFIQDPRFKPYLRNKEKTWFESLRGRLQIRTSPKWEAVRIADPPEVWEACHQAWGWGSHTHTGSLNWGSWVCPLCEPVLSLRRWLGGDAVFGPTSPLGKEELKLLVEKEPQQCAVSELFSQPWWTFDRRIK